MHILVADRNPAVRSAVTVYLRSMLECDTVREAVDADDLLAQAGALRPDIVLLDWGPPERARTELLAGLRACDPRPSVIALGSYLEERVGALATGADYFVCKGDPPRHLLAAVRLAEADRCTA
jgi:DNA-binding NarL/FixJ family response regulator